jgi:hypothetical protein
MIAFILTASFVFVVFMLIARSGEHGWNESFDGEWVPETPQNVLRDLELERYRAAFNAARQTRERNIKLICTSD